MSANDFQEPTPAHVADLATQSISLPALALIGVFGSAHNPAALIRVPDGSMTRVNIGDTVVGSTVAAIDMDRVVLAKGAHTKVLTLPTT